MSGTHEPEEKGRDKKEQENISLKKPHKEMNE